MSSPCFTPFDPPLSPRIIHDTNHFLMEEHQLGLADLPDIGTPEMILAILNGQQDLTVKQLKSLSTRFQVSPAIFI